MVQEAMYDAVNAHRPYRQRPSTLPFQVPEGTAASPEAAASEAAFDVLSSLIPQEQALYNATLAESLGRHSRRCGQNRPG